MGEDVGGLGSPLSWLPSQLAPLLLRIPGEETEAQEGNFLPVSHLLSGNSDLRAQVLTTGLPQQSA